MVTVSLALVFVLAIALRVAPVVFSPRGVGIDHWYWKTYVETYRRERQFPPSLPQYLLEEQQWYPPLFPMLLVRLPDAVFERLNAVIAIGIDLLRMLLLVVVAMRASGGNPSVVLIAALLYATSPIQVSYNVQLNPRGLAALMLDGLLILLLARLDGGAGWWVWPGVVLLSGLILLTHKMTTQLFWFLVLGTAVVYRNAGLLLLIPLSIAAALLFSRGFYWNVLRAHWDIVAFWNRNWPWIGADQIRESPLYGDGTYERSAKLHRRGFIGVLRQAVGLFAFNPAAWIACLLAYERFWREAPVLFYPSYLLVWLLLQCLFACLTTWVPRLKCLGAGYLYVLNASLISSLLLGITFKQTLVPWLSKPFIIFALCCNIGALIVYFVHFYRNPRSRVHEGLDRLIDELRAMPRGVVMCLPANWYEVVAYKTGQPVMWGGHGYGFRKLEPVWPRLLIPLSEVFDRYRIRYLLTMDGMVPETVMAELPPSSTISHGEYHLYCFAGEPADGRVEWKDQPPYSAHAFRPS